MADILSRITMDIKPLPADLRLIVMEPHIYQIRLETILTKLENNMRKQAIAPLVHTRSEVEDGKADEWLSQDAKEAVIDLINQSILGCFEGRVYDAIKCIRELIKFVKFTL